MPSSSRDPEHEIDAVANGSPADPDATVPDPTAVGDARPVSLLGLRIAEPSAESAATVTRRPVRNRPGGGRPDGTGGRAVLVPSSGRKPTPRGAEGSAPRAAIMPPAVRPAVPPAVAPPVPPMPADPVPAPQPAATPPETATPATPTPTAPTPTAAVTGWTPDLGSYPVREYPARDYQPRALPAAPPPFPPPGETPAFTEPESPGQAGFYQAPPAAEIVPVQAGWPEPVRPAGPTDGRWPEPAWPPAPQVADPPARGLLAGGRRVVVGGFGGGSGRTTVAAGLGMAMAAQRHDRVVAVDACPDQCGPLATRAGLTGRGIGLRELVAADPPVSSLTELRRFLASSGPAGLEVLPGVHDLAGPGLSAEELAWALDVVERWFPIVIADGPPGWLQPVSATLLARADTLVVTARAGSESTLAEDALTALATAGRSDLCAGAVVAVVETGPGRLGRLGGLARRRSDSVGRLAERVHAVVPIPFDPALTGGAAFTWQRLRRRTRAAFEALATAVEEAPQVAYPPPPALDPAAPYDYLSWSGATAS